MGWQPAGMDSYLVRIWRPAGPDTDDDLRGVVTDLATHTTTTFADQAALLRLLGTPHPGPDAERSAPGGLVAEVGP